MPNHDMWYLEQQLILALFIHLKQESGQEIVTVRKKGSPNSDNNKINGDNHQVEQRKVLIITDY